MCELHKCLESYNFCTHGDIDQMKACNFLLKQGNKRRREKKQHPILAPKQNRKRRTTYRGSHGAVKQPLDIGSQAVVVNGEGGMPGDAVEDQAGEEEVATAEIGRGSSADMEERLDRRGEDMAAPVGVCMVAIGTSQLYSREGWPLIKLGLTH